MKDMLNRGNADAAMWVPEETFEENLIYAITLPMPETASQWKAIAKFRRSRQPGNPFSIGLNIGQRATVPQAFT